MTFQGFDVFDIDRAEGFTATFLGADSAVLGVLTNTMPIGNNGFASFDDLGLAGVMTAVFGFSSSGAIDDLAFDVAAPVPVPAAALLFATGAGGLFARRKLAKG